MILVYNGIPSDNFLVYIYISPDYHCVYTKYNSNGNKNTMIITGWWYTYPPGKIWKSDWIIIPTIIIGENKSHAPNHQPNNDKHDQSANLGNLWWPGQPTEPTMVGTRTFSGPDSVGRFGWVWPMGPRSEALLVAVLRQKMSNFLGPKFHQGISGDWHVDPSLVSRSPAKMRYGVDTINRVLYTKMII